MYSLRPTCANHNIALCHFCSYSPKSAGDNSIFWWGTSSFVLHPNFFDIGISCCSGLLSSRPASYHNHRLVPTCTDHCLHHCKIRITGHIGSLEFVFLEILTLYTNCFHKIYRSQGQTDWSSCVIWFRWKLCRNKIHKSVFMSKGKQLQLSLHSMRGVESALYCEKAGWIEASMT